MDNEFPQETEQLYKDLLNSYRDQVRQPSRTKADFDELLGRFSNLIANIKESPLANWD